LILAKSKPLKSSIGWNLSSIGIALVLKVDRSDECVYSRLPFIIQIGQLRVEYTLVVLNLFFKVIFVVLLYFSEFSLGIFLVELCIGGFIVECCL